VKILFDNNVPTFLLPALSAPEATTAYRQGWHELANGRLLDAAEAAGFELFVTLDGGFKHQQNMKGRKIAVAVMEPENQSRSAMFVIASDLVAKLNEVKPGTILVVSRRRPLP
jgi:predicted nuclease of predicted toxin-antitoxin system